MVMASGKSRSRIAAMALILAALFSSVAAGCARLAKDPYVRSSRDERFVVVIHGEADRKQAKVILGLLEANADRIKADLGVADSSAYTVHVRADDREFQSIMRQLTGNSFPGCTGYISGRYRAEILENPSAAQDALHEYVHSMSLFLQRNWYNKPRWLWESLAIYESGEFHDPRDISRLAFDDFPTLDELDQEFGDSKLIYRTGYLLLEFMKETWGMPAVLELVRRYGDVQAVFGVSREEFEKRWTEFVKRKYLAG